MGEKIFTNLQVLRNKCSSIEDFVDKLKDITRDKTAVIVNKSKRRESLAGNCYWEYFVKSEHIRIDNDKRMESPEIIIWITDDSYIGENTLSYWYLRIKD